MDHNSSVKPLPEHAKKMFTGKIFEVWQWEQELFDGSKATFERLKRPDYAHVTVVLPDQRILLISDEQPDRDAVLTPAGGKVEEGESPEVAARRELKEETGYQVEELRHWHNYKPHSKMEYHVHGYIGIGGKKVSEPTPDAGEKIEIVTFSLDEYLRLGRNPKLRDWMLRIKLLEMELDHAKQREFKKLLYG